MILTNGSIRDIKITKRSPEDFALLFTDTFF